MEHAALSSAASASSLDGPSSSSSATASRSSSCSGLTSEEGDVPRKGSVRRSLRSVSHSLGAQEAQEVQQKVLQRIRKDKANRADGGLQDDLKGRASKVRFSLMVKDGRGIQYVDELAQKRLSHIEVQIQATRRQSLRGVHALQKLDSMMSSRGLEEPGPNEIRSPRALARWAVGHIPALEGCSDTFLSSLSRQAEQVHLKAGEVQELASIAATRGGCGASRSAVAILVQTGLCRIEAGPARVDECAPGQSFGVAAVLSGVIGGNVGKSEVSEGPALTLRAAHMPDGCRLLLFRATNVRRALAESPADQEKLRGLIKLLSRPCDSTQQILWSLQSAEAARNVVASSSTRHLALPGEIIAKEGARRPEALILVRGGTVSVEIDGVEVRRLTDGQVVGAEALMNVSQRWTVTVRCITACDLQVLHRRVLNNLVSEIGDVTPEEEREVQRLQLLLDGKWREEKVVLSLPLFKGYDPEFLSALAKRVETRVVLPGAIVQESVSKVEGQELALYFVMHGTADEVQGASKKEVEKPETRKSRRSLASGTSFGIQSFLGLKDSMYTQVTARSLCILSVLHHASFLAALNRHPKDVQAPEVARLVLAELDLVEPLGAEEPSGGQLLAGLPLFKGCSEAFLEWIVKNATRTVRLKGQILSKSGVPTSTMYVVARGELMITLANVEISRLKRGEAVNFPALAIGFTPSYEVVCTRVCELWSLSRADLELALTIFPSEKRRLALLMDVNLDKLVSVDDSPGERRNSGSGASFQMGDDASAPALNLTREELFHHCSIGFLEWIKDHMELTIHFKDEAFMKEKDEQECLYIIISGTVIMEGSGTNFAQVSLTRGASFNERLLLEVEQQAGATAVAVELTLMQRLHRKVFAKGLQRFPADRAHFDQVALTWIKDSDRQHLSSAPIFKGCGSDFVQKAAVGSTMRLIHKGDVLSQAGSKTERLSILRFGEAKEEGSPPRQLGLLAAINAEMALGVAKTVAKTIRAERLCVVDDLDKSSLLNALQAHPEEVGRIMKFLFNGSSIFPFKPEQVPFFADFGHALFLQLVQTVERRMFLPEQTIVSQGSIGNSMYIIGYGTATHVVDGIAVSTPLAPGDVSGAANMLGLFHKYRATLRARTVCHVLIVTADNLKRLFIDNPADRDRFDHLQEKVRSEASEKDKSLLKEVAKEKLKRRVDAAFRRHVTCAQGQAPNEEALLVETLINLRRSSLDSGDSGGESPSMLSEQRSNNSSQSTLVVLRSEIKKLKSHQRGLRVSVEGLEKPVNQQEEDEGPVRKLPPRRASAVPTLGQRAQVLYEDARAEAEEAQGREKKTRWVLPKPTDALPIHMTTGQDPFTAYNQFCQDQLATSIREFSEHRKEAVLKGKLIRCVRHGLPLDGLDRGGARHLSEEDLELLDDVLPAGPSQDSRSVGCLSDTDTSSPLLRSALAHFRRLAKAGTRGHRRRSPPRTAR